MAGCFFAKIFRMFGYMAPVKVDFSESLMHDVLEKGESVMTYWRERLFPGCTWFDITVDTVTCLGIVGCFIWLAFTLPYLPISK